MDNRLNAVLVDDEPLLLQSMAMLLHKYCPQVNIIASFSSPSEALKAIPNLDFDLLFLDVFMPDIDGFKMLEQLDLNRFKVIFITASENFGAQAFRVNAVDYLLKPVTPEDLVAAVQKATVFSLPVLSQPVVLPMTDKMLDDRIPVSATDGIHILDINNILYMEASSNYTTFHLKTGKSITASKNLAFYEQLLPLHKFFRIHNSFLVRLGFITKYIRGEGGFVEMPDGRQLEVSRRKKTALLKLLNVL